MLDFLRKCRSLFSTGFFLGNWVILAVFVFSNFRIVNPFLAEFCNFIKIYVVKVWVRFVEGYKRTIKRNKFDFKLDVLRLEQVV